MDISKSLIPLLESQEQATGILIIKDFIGFLNWDPSLGAILVPYVGHHCQFCTALKQNDRAYQHCVNCSMLHQKLMQRYKKPIFRPCFMGLSEYSAPIMINGECVGSVSTGMYCLDYSLSIEKIHSLSEECNMNKGELIRCLDETVTSGKPIEEKCAVIRFLADLLSMAFSPYANAANIDEPEPEETAFRQVLRYIYQHYDNPKISVKEIAHACRYSSSHVSHVFNRRMNMNVRTYVNYLRILQAKKLLKTEHRISSVAYGCGFNDANYFCIVFKQLVGMPPTRFLHNQQDKSDTSL